VINTPTGISSVIGGDDLLDAELLSRAVVVWTGWGRTPTPARDESALVAAFDDELGIEVLVHVRALEDEFYRSNANNEAPDLTATGERVAGAFRATRPDIGEEAVGALVWCYTFDVK
jgi:hypothetical protein